nr:MAG TPA: 4Fe-4S binding domain protein [Caudoviricetes sp.]
MNKHLSISYCAKCKICTIGCKYDGIFYVLKKSFTILLEYNTSC